MQLTLPKDDSTSDRIWLRNLATGKLADIFREDLPWIAKYIGRLSDGDVEVEFPRVADGRTLRYRLARAHAFPLHNGRRQILRSVLARIMIEPKNFSPGDIVRYRDSRGLMREGQHPCADANETFKKWSPGTSNSILFDSSLLTNEMPHSIPLNRPSGLLREFLNAAAHLSAHPEFNESSFNQRLELTIQFQNIVLPSTYAANTLEMTGVRTLSQVLCAGTGLCRHTSPLIAAVLAEAGLEVRIMHRIADAIELADNGDSHSAHAWIEVVAPNGEIVVVDPTNRTVRSLAASEARAHANPDSFDACWWAHQAKQALIPKRL